MTPAAVGRRLSGSQVRAYVVRITDDSGGGAMIDMERIRFGGRVGDEIRET